MSQYWNNTYFWKFNLIKILVCESKTNFYTIIKDRTTDISQIQEFSLYWRKQFFNSIKFPHIFLLYMIILEKVCQTRF